MIKISVNNEKKQLSAALSVSELLQQLGFDSGKVAVAINMEFVARSEYAVTFLKEGDKVDVLAPVQGG